MLKLFRAFNTRAGEARRGPESGSEAATRFASSSTGETATRKQLLAIVHREMLLRNGVPAAWVGMQFFRTLDRSGSRAHGIHVRFIVHDGHDAVAVRMVALERDFRWRVGAVDYRAEEWLQGISWQFDLPEDVPQELVARGVAAAPREPQRAHRRVTYAATEPAAF